MQSAQADPQSEFDHCRNEGIIGKRILGNDIRQVLEEDETLSSCAEPGIPLREPYAQLTLLAATLRIEDLVTANRCKDEFLATLCHELRSPLASIQNAVSVLRTQGGETEMLRRMHALIDRQARHMSLLVADLLDVSRITSGNPHLQTERLDLCAVVRNAIEAMEWDLKQRNHLITTTWPESPIWLQADARRLEQVFVNLLINGSKYMDSGGELILSVQVEDGSAVVSVRDRGIGIAPELLPHIFDLFVQADEAALRSRYGLGVGLALVRMVVDQHGGSVGAASAGHGHGSEFTVRLPVRT